MPSFVKGGTTYSDPVGPNVYLRSTQDVKKESYSVAAGSVATETINGITGQKVLQKGEVMAKITSGPDAGKVGPFQAAGTSEQQVLTKAGTVSGGTFTLSFGGQTTAPIAWNATAAQVSAALELLSTIGDDNVDVTGGPIASTPFTIVFQGALSGDTSPITADATLLTGAGAGVTPSTSVVGVAGAVDGRGVLANIVGINDTYLPWQLLEHDEQIAVTYECTAVQAWCFERSAAGVRIVLTNTTAAALQRGGAAGKGVDVSFK